MLTTVHTNKPVQLILGFLMGILFGILLQKAGGADYDIILNQLLLKDFTVVKIMLSAVIVGMIGVHLMKDLGMVKLHVKPGSYGKMIWGGLLFGIGFATLGYCPGTIMAAVGQGSLDSLAGGVVGILIGSAIFANIYPRLKETVLAKGDFGEKTIPEMLKVNHWVVVIPAVIILVVILYVLETAGL